MEYFGFTFFSPCDILFIQMDPEILIGTSGYDYPEWSGVFYPPEVKRKDYLLYYSTVFNALELNNTFYNMPDSKRIESFMERSENRVALSIKANRSLTHEVDTLWKNKALDFKEALAPAKEKNLLSTVLFQFPQSFHYTAQNRFYLSDLIQEFEGFPLVIEFRHIEWIKDSVFEGLLKRGVSVAFCDMPQLKALPNADFSDSVYTRFIGPQAYIRLHGRNAQAWYADSASQDSGSRYNYDYSESEIFEFVPVIKAARRENRKVSVFFNNHPKGSSPKDAKILMKMLNY